MLLNNRGVFMTLSVIYNGVFCENMSLSHQLSSQKICHKCLIKACVKYTWVPPHPEFLDLSVLANSISSSTRKKFIFPLTHFSSMFLFYTLWKRQKTCVENSRFQKYVEMLKYTRKSLNPGNKRNFIIFFRTALDMEP